MVVARRRLTAPALVSVACLLAACAAQKLPPPPAPEEARVPAPRAAIAVPDAPTPAVPAAPSADVAPREAPPPALPQSAALPPRMPPVPTDTKQLIGLSPEKLQSLLGAAPFVRSDGPVQIWRYAADDCFLDVFLYRERGGFNVQHVEARSKGSARVTAASCYGRLLAARRDGRTG